MNEDKQFTAEEAIEIMKLKIQQESVEDMRASIEKEIKEKFSKSKGKIIEVTLTCASCTRDFKVKRKNNKSEDTVKQLCPHIILKNWEVKF